MNEDVIKMHLLSALQLLGERPSTADDWRYIEHDLAQAARHVGNNIEEAEANPPVMVKVKDYKDLIRQISKDEKREK